VINFIREKKDLISYFEEGCTPVDEIRFGTEHELFLYKKDSFDRLRYLDTSGRDIYSIFRLMETLGWLPVKEEAFLLSLKKNGAVITLEPSGQIELSGIPLKFLHDTYNEITFYHKDLKFVCDKLGVAISPMGSDFSSGGHYLMPKGRYKLMVPCMHSAKHGLDMMRSTCTTQVNLDYISEEDMVKKFQVSLKLQPILTAIFSNSPYGPCMSNRYSSHRSFYWQHTDSRRCGLVRRSFSNSFSFEEYVDFALDVPMYFVSRGGGYLNIDGQSFRDFMNGKLRDLPGQIPTTHDWVNHLSTIFTEVRLKQFIEMRGADGGDKDHIMSFVSFWVGVLYDKNNLDFCDYLTKSWTVEDVNTLLLDCSRDGLDSLICGVKISELFNKILHSVLDCLGKRSNTNSCNQNETIYLEYLFKIFDRRNKSVFFKRDNKFHNIY
jgi:glutamate--cysteine ligase